MQDEEGAEGKSCEIRKHKGKVRWETLLYRVRYIASYAGQAIGRLAT